MNQQPAFNGLDIAIPVLSAGGSQIRISAKGIEVITGGKFEVKAGQHQFLGGTTASAEIPALPILTLPSRTVELNYLYDDLKPVAQAPYKLVFEDGSMQEGLLDNNGYAKATIPGDKKQPKVYYGFSSLDATPDQQKLDNRFKDNQVMSITEAEQLLEQYNQQELDALLDDYFPDEIEEMINGSDIEYDDHVSDYEEQLIAQYNNAADGIADDAEEILLNEGSSSQFKSGDDA